VTAESLVGQLEKHGWRGQIVGPHGSGKSTLLAELVSKLHAREVPTQVTALHDGQRHLPVGFLDSLKPGVRTILIIDGYEQLSFSECIKLRLRSGFHGHGLLVTTHSPALFLATLITLTTSTTLLSPLLNRLTAGFQPLISEHDAAVSFARHSGNLREVWFDLYDQYERNRRTIAQAGQAR
jgi:hypothetical protein